MFGLFKKPLRNCWVIKRNLGFMSNVPLYFTMKMKSGYPITSFRIREAQTFQTEEGAKAVIFEWALCDDWRAVMAKGVEK